MSYKWLGAILIVLGCSGFGFYLAAGYRAEERLLRQLVRSLQYMQWELQYRLTALPDLCRQAGREAGGTLREVFEELARELDSRTAPEVHSCMRWVLGKRRELPSNIRKLLLQLGRSLGRFDLEGQLAGLESLQKACEREADLLAGNREYRLRSYQTLSICAGTALAILFA